MSTYSRRSRPNTGSNSQKGSNSPPLSVVTASSRVSQLSSFSDYSYDELTKKIFYSLEGDAGGSLRRSSSVDTVDFAKYQIQRIPQALGIPLHSQNSDAFQLNSKGEHQEAGTEFDMVGIPLTSTTEEESGNYTSTPEHTPSRFVFESTPGSKSPQASVQELGSQVVTPLTTPTQHLNQPQESLDIAAESASNLVKRSASTSECSLTISSRYSCIKLSPPPKRKGSIGKSNASLLSTMPPLSEIPTIPSELTTPRSRRATLPSSHSPILSPAKHIRFLSNVDSFNNNHNAVGDFGTPSTSAHPLATDSTISPSAGRHKPPSTSSPLVLERTLFLFGFIFSWCWLIGGWLLPPPSHVCVHSPTHLRQRTSRDRLLPMHHNRSDGWRSHVLTLSNNPTRNGLASVAANFQSQSRRISIRHRWGRRCRIAAVTISVILAALLGVVIWCSTTRG